MSYCRLPASKGLTLWIPLRHMSYAELHVHTLGKHMWQTDLPLCSCHKLLLAILCCQRRRSPKCQYHYHGARYHNGEFHHPTVTHLTRHCLCYCHCHFKRQQPDIPLIEYLRKSLANNPQVSENTMQ